MSEQDAPRLERRRPETRAAPSASACAGARRGAEVGAAPLPLAPRLRRPRPRGAGAPAPPAVDPGRALRGHRRIDPARGAGDQVGRDRPRRRSPAGSRWASTPTPGAATSATRAVRQQHRDDVPHPGLRPLALIVSTGCAASAKLRHAGAQADGAARPDLWHDHRRHGRPRGDLPCPHGRSARDRQGRTSSWAAWGSRRRSCSGSPSSWPITPVPLGLRQARTDVDFVRLGTRALHRRGRDFFPVDHRHRARLAELRKDDQIVVLADGLEEALSRGGLAVRRQR